MPGIDWLNESIKHPCNFKTLYTDFMENLIDFNLEQMVKTSTRDDNILDLFLTNNLVRYIPQKLYLVSVLLITI